jgi:deoxyribodipyrimidine photo-lyase
MGRVEQEGLDVIIGRDYPGPIVDHAQARAKTLARYAVVKK